MTVVGSIRITVLPALMALVRLARGCDVRIPLARNGDFSTGARRTGGLVVRRVALMELAVAVSWVSGAWASGVLA
ncbi:hypothetical protein GCM10027029_21530 [Conyzicola lurida]